MNTKKLFLLTSLLVVASMLFSACGQAATTVPTTAPQATEVVEEPTEAVEPTEEATEAVEPTEEPTEVVEATEAPTEAVEPTEAEAAPCAPATDGPLAGVDPSGQTVVWWHNHSGSREENLLPLLEQFNTTNECGIVIEAQNQGGYNDIRDKVNASIAAGELPAALVVGYQN